MIFRRGAEVCDTVSVSSERVISHATYPDQGVPSTAFGPPC